MSQGEQLICKLLTQAGIPFTREKTFSDLKHGLFRFDFYITLKNGSTAIIEYNGKQHYEFVPKFYKSPLEFRQAQGRDMRKISWALGHNIPLYIIPYWELNSIKQVSDIINKRFLATNQYKNFYDWENFTKQHTSK